MPKPTIAQLKARIGSLEKDVIELQKLNHTLAARNNELKECYEMSDSHRNDLVGIISKRETELRAVLLTIKLLVTTP